MYAVISRSRHVHDKIGTGQVTALGMFAGGGGFAIAPPTLASLAVVVAGISTSRVEIDRRIETRDLSHRVGRRVDTGNRRHDEARSTETQTTTSPRVPRPDQRRRPCVIRT